MAISGSIAAYKCAALARLFVKAGAEVQVLMTEAAEGFISPLTMATLSKKPAISNVHTGEGWNNHVALGLWADVLLVVPATANTLAKMANGLCDNILTAVYLSARCPVFIAPAMDLDMWHHPATGRNLALLQKDGVQLVPVGHGELASGLVGDGRMAEPEDILHILDAFFKSKNDFAGVNALVTAGPTYEPLDPVRFIGNHSSGKMGIAIADELAKRGANVTLVLGPSKVAPTHPNVRTLRVQTAQQMYDASLAAFAQSKVAVLAAAVADYRPKVVASQKIKKKTSSMSLKLEKTPDIAAALGKAKSDGQRIIGFALETQNELENARGKLQRKNMDGIVLNSLNDTGAGFNHDTNRITFLSANGEVRAFGLKSKAEVAKDIVDALREML